MIGPMAWTAGLAALAGALACATSTTAQIGPLTTPRLPGLPSGVTDRLPDVGRVQGLAGRAVDEALQAPSRLTGLVRRSRGALEADPLGWPVVSGEIVALDLSDEARREAMDDGYHVLRDERLEALDLTTTVLAPPRRLSLARAVERLQALDPGAEITFNHVHAPAGAIEGRTSSAPAVSAPQRGGARLGLIDTGVDAAHPALTGSRIIQRGFAGTSRIGAHGTAVASLMVGRSGAFSGGAPGADLLVADIYGGQATGGASTTLAQALAWMVEQRATVVNVSLVGPRNSLVERAIARAQAEGVIVVAAVGNDGPAAPPLYPAAYAGVVGVTGVSGRNQVLPEAARGAHVDFAAPGADMAAAGSGGGWTSVRGTSFAAPIVAGLLAMRGQSALESQATDLGERGRDPVYGTGLVGTAARVAPSAVGARRRLRP
ncbi:S8 family serine peptidase [Brevundimonas sp. AAP58]|uniref:S8 family serine peptidase n=1 Tax=Brevundimonas sp. AAP58 TaxID=1523422 RepID=UPI000AA80BD5|nr:S8 family serine peptidase [Brevundimonas sp. AAP58]